MKYRPIAAKLQAAWNRTSFLVPWILTAAFTALVALTAAHHEMWRDELQAWLLARDAASPLALLHNMRYEGHPGLWHLLLWPLTRLTWNPAAMQVLHVTLASMSAFILLRWAPMPMPLKVLILCGYFFTYEWAVIARNYAVSVTLLFAVCALFRDRWKNFIYISALLFLLCHTNIHSILITMVFTLYLAIEFAVAYAAKARNAHLNTPRFALGLLLILLGLSSGIAQTAPPEDTGFATQWHYEWTEARREQTFAKVINAYLPVPADTPQPWNSNRFLSPRGTGDGSAMPPLIESRNTAKVAVLMLACTALPFFRRPWPCALYLPASLALLAFFYIKLPGAFRHHGFLYLAFIVALWISYYYKPWPVTRPRLEAALGFIDRHRAWLFLPLFAVQAWGAGKMISNDWTSTFSASKDAANWINSRFPDKGSVMFAGTDGPACSAVVGNMMLKSMFYTERGEFGSYVIWDRKRAGNYERLDLSSIEHLMLEKGVNAVVVSTARIPKRSAPGRLSELARFDKGMLPSEHFYVYLLERAAN